MSMRILLLLSLVATLDNAAQDTSKEIDRDPVPQARIHVQLGAPEAGTYLLLLVIVRDGIRQEENGNPLKAYLDSLKTPRPTSHL